MSYRNLICVVFLALGIAFGQEPTTPEPVSQPQFVYGALKSQRFINLTTFETNQKKTMGFRISHRFAPIDGGFQQWFGLDGGASIWLSLDYALTDRFMLGVGRTSTGKLFDGFAKYRLLWQTTDNSMPVSVTLYGRANVSSLTDPYLDQRFTRRVSYVSQVIIGRKFSERFSAQLSPTWIHENLVASDDYPNDVFALGVAAKCKVKKNMALLAEYTYNFTPSSDSAVQFGNSLGLGIEFETGGHSFQLNFVNSFGLNEVQTVPYTLEKWGKQVRFGFNISRDFWF